VLIDGASTVSTAAAAFPSLLGFKPDDVDSESTSAPPGTDEASFISISAALPLFAIVAPAERCAAFADDGRNRCSAALVPRTPDRRVASRAAMTSNDAADLGAGIRAGSAAKLRAVVDDDEDDDEDDVDSMGMQAVNAAGDADDSACVVDRNTPVSSASEAAAVLLVSSVPFTRVAVSVAPVFGGGRSATRCG
jgi:hypothetical protein